MSVNIYARQAPLSDACGRADYISSEHRQENLMATATTISQPDYWQLLSADSQAAFRQAGGSKTKEDGTELKACEAREIHVQLPNSALERMQADQLARKIANDFRSQYGVDCLVAIHYNKKKNNLHCHIMFSERQQLPEPDIKIADRNVFLDATGTRKRTKKEILDADGQLLPGCSIVKKGEVWSARYFGDKNPMFAEKSWMDEYRHYMADWINENLQPDELRTVYDKNGPYLAQKHLGPLKDNEDLASKRRDIEEWNGLVKEFNHIVDAGGMTLEEAVDFKTRVLLSPDQTQELRAVLAELYREMYPDDPSRPGWDRAAAQAAATPLSPTVENRQAKQELRELYKAHGKARIAVIDAPSDFDAMLKKAEVSRLDQQIARKKVQAGVAPELQRVREIGRLAGLKKEEVDRMYQAAPRMTGQQWSQVWSGCRAATAQYWDGYRARQQKIQSEIDAAYKLRRKVKAAEWAIDPRNRRKSLLGIVWAAIVLSRNGSLMILDHEIRQLKNEQTALRRGVQQFKAATTETYDTLHTKGLDPEKYLASVERLQRMADQVSRDVRLQRQQTRDHGLSR